MKKFVLAGAAALAMLAGCASGPTIRTHIDPAANLSNYKTYMFPERTGTDRGDVSTRITSGRGVKCRCACRIQSGSSNIATEPAFGRTDVL